MAKPQMYFAQLDRRAGPQGAGDREARPFEQEGLEVRLAPFIGLTVLTLAVVPFAYDGMTTEIGLSWAILAMIVGSAFFVPWGRLPAFAQSLPILSLYIVAALVRDATGGASSVFTALVLLPVVWFALYGTMADVLASVLGCALSIGLPVVLDPGSAKYPTSEFGRAALDSVMSGALGITGVHLMRRIREREELSRSILDSAHEAFISMDENGRIVEWSWQAEREFGWSSAEALGRSLAETIIPEQNLSEYQPAIQRMLDGDRLIIGRRLELSAVRRNGTQFPVELSFSTLETSHGTRFNVFVHDISERRSSEHALQEANQRFRSAFDDAAIGMAIVSPEGRWLRANRALSELTGYPQDQLVGMGFADITHPDDLPKDIHALQEMIDGQRDRFQTEKRYFHAEGHVIWCWLSTTIVRDSEGKPMYLLSQMQDISERKATEERLAHRASHDELTGLPNRGVLEDRMVLALNRQRRERKPIAVLYLDLDGFKRVNDTHGHDAGDYLLIAIAKRLTALVRPTDVVSRLGGDEFVILCEGMDERGATQLAKRIVEVVPNPIEVEGSTLAVAPSVGIALSRDPGRRPGELLADADMAMYFAKEEARSGYAFYEDELRQRARSRFALDPELNP
jgi:diguanylate cyclase (GGDEF)-like protein/PAS domain S-box-containing protein